MIDRDFEFVCKCYGDKLMIPIYLRSLKSSFNYYLAGDRKVIYPAFQILIGYFEIVEIDENDNLIGRCFQAFRESKRDQFDQFIQKSIEFCPRMNELKLFFNQLKEGEIFFIFPTDNIDSNQDLEIGLSLEHYNKISDSERTYRIIEDRMGELFQFYDRKTIDISKHKKIGVFEKTKRVCRFCKKKIPETSFENASHAVSKFLGNSAVYLNEECDNCNNYFSSTIEEDFRKNIDIARYHKRMVSEDDFECDVNVNNKFSLATSNKSLLIDVYEKMSEKDYEEFKKGIVTMRTGDTIVFQNVYKCLAKYALSVLDSDLILNYKETCGWVSASDFVDKLPIVKVISGYDIFMRKTEIVVYQRKDFISKYFPRVVCEFRYGYMMYVFILPLCDDEHSDFLNQKDYDKYWSLFKHFSSREGWQDSDFSNHKPTELKYTFEVGKQEDEQDNSTN